MKTPYNLCFASTLYTAILCYSNPMLYMLLHAVHLVHSNPDPNRTLRISIFFRWRRWNLSETERTERTIVKERRTICCEMCLLMRHLKWTLPRPGLFFTLGGLRAYFSSASRFLLIHTVGISFSPSHRILMKRMTERMKAGGAVDTGENERQ